jgi:hypothetical protein
MWAGMRKVLQQIRALLHNFLWAGSEHTTQCRVQWKAGRLGLVESEEAFLHQMGAILDATRSFRFADSSMI